MKLLTNEIRKQLPAMEAIYEWKDDEDPMVYTRFFTSDNGWNWYVLAGSPFLDSTYPDDFLFHGWVVGPEKEFGDFSLRNLEELRIGFRKLSVERDRLFKSTPLSEIRKQYS